MGKRSIKDGTTTVLFQKSYHTIYTHSRTCSATSQQYTKNSLVNLKKNLSENKQYYLDGDKVKRDLSIETDICIFRRYCKKIKNKMSVQEGSRSKYSTVVDTEINTIDEFEADVSACGDSEQTDQTNMNLDLTNAVMENLKDLLHNWITKFLMETKDDKAKLQNVLYTILHKDVGEKTTNSSSKSTYVLNRSSLSQVKNKRIGTVSICEHCEEHKKKTKKRVAESSRHSSPISLKKLKVISTLSIPRNLHKTDKKNKSKKNNKTNDIMHKKLVLSINKSDHLDISSFDFLSVSAETFTRRCANLNIKSDSSSKKKRHIVFFPKPFYKSATDSSSEGHHYISELNSNKNNLLEMPSLVQSIYAGDPADIVSSDEKNTKIDHFTMTENNYVGLANIHTVNEKNQLEKVNFEDDQSSFERKTALKELEASEPLITIDFIDELTDTSNQTRTRKSFSSRTVVKTSELENPAKQSVSAHDGKMKAWKTKYKRNKLRAYNRISKFHSFHSKQFTFLYKKTNNTHFSQEKQFLEHFQHVFKYFHDYNKNNDLKLNINVNIIPLRDISNHDETTMTCNQACSTTTSDAIFYNFKPNINIQNGDKKNKDKESSEIIIPILDGTLSQSKYLLRTESQVSIYSHHCSLKGDNKERFDCGTVTEIGLTNDIKELKNVIKDLAKAAEDIVKDHVKQDPKVFQYVNNMTCTVDNNSTKGIQLSNEFDKQPIISGIKLSKCPKKDTGELYKRIMQKSISYNIIDSERILKVTDMTSNANNVNSNTIVNKTPKSRSLIEIADDTKKLLTYYCGRTKTNTFSDRSKRKRVELCDPGVTCGSSDFTVDSREDCSPQNMLSTNSTYSDVDEEKSLVCAKRKRCRERGMGFGEGLFYCIMMWIPFIIVFCLFYQHVIYYLVLSSKQNYNNGTNSTTTTPPTPQTPPTPPTSGNGSGNNDNNNNQTLLRQNQYAPKGLFYIKLSDLGF